MDRDKLRKVTFLDEYLDSHDGYFHEWILHDGVQAIVEDINGAIRLVDYKKILFKIEGKSLTDMF